MADSNSVTPIQKSLVFSGVVTSVANSNRDIGILALAGYGDTFFQNWTAYCVRKANGTTTSPFQTSPLVALYTSRTGLFAFSTAPGLAIGDEVYLIHPDLASVISSLGLPTDSPLGVALTTGTGLAYLKGLVKEKQSQSLGGLADMVRALYYDGTYLYAGCAGTPATILKIDPVTMTVLATWTGAAGQDNCTALTHDGTYLYAALYTAPAVVVQISTPTMVTQGTVWTGAAGQDNATSLAFDSTTGADIYVGLATAPGLVIKLTGMVTAGIWTGAGGENYVIGLIYDRINTMVVAALSINPAQVKQITPATMLTFATFTAAAFNTNAYSLAFDGVYYYLGTNNAFTNGVVIKIDGAMALAGTWVSSDTRAYALVWDGLNLYAGASLPLLSKIKSSDMTLIGEWRPDPKDSYTVMGSTWGGSASDGTNVFIATTKVVAGVMTYGIIKVTIRAYAPDAALTLSSLAVPAIGSAANVLERDVIGNKADQPNYTTSDASIVFSLMSWLRGLARAKIQFQGNAQAGSSASLLVDAGNLVGGVGSYLGQHVLMMDGANMGLSRPVSAFNDVTDTVTLDPAFPNAIGVGDNYILLSDYTPVVPIADIATNTMASHVIGNKADAAVTAVGVVASIIAYIKGVLNQIAHATYGLSAIQVIVAAVKVMTDKIGTITNTGGTATIGAILGDFANKTFVGRLTAINNAPVEIWSTYTNQVQLTTGAGDKALQNITIAGIPTGATVTRAIILFKFGERENTNGAVNSISGAQNIQVQKAVAGAYVTGIALAGGEYSTPLTSGVVSGDVMMGTTDVSAQVPANGAVMNAKWTSGLAAQNNFNFNNVQWGIRIWTSI